MLRIKASHPEARLVPTYDIDLAWHTHQSQPHAYKADTIALLGAHWDHDDSVNDRAPDATLADWQAKTEDLWQRYGLSFFQSGGMWRGPPPGSLDVPLSAMPTGVPLSGSLLYTYTGTAARWTPTAREV
jgi:hypothetical protein